MEKQKNIPELRFPEFEVEWEKRNLGKISVKINSGKTPSGGESVYTEKGILETGLIITFIGTGPTARLTESGRCQPNAR